MSEEQGKEGQWSLWRVYSDEIGWWCHHEEKLGILFGYDERAHLNALATADVLREYESASRDDKARIDLLTTEVKVWKGNHDAQVRAKREGHEKQKQHYEARIRELEEALRRAHDVLDDFNAEQDVKWTGCRFCAGLNYNGDGLNHSDDCIIRKIRVILGGERG